MLNEQEDKLLRTIDRVLPLAESEQAIRNQIRTLGIEPYPTPAQLNVEELKEAKGLIESLSACRQAIADFVEVHKMAKSGKWDNSLAVTKKWNICVDKLETLLAGVEER